ncbi:MAG: PilZ domain-containing protein [Candidatus Omnitrophica bacterium]|nr:PilZ domain-containing protein [Candidatus Omnitrophota bacterium]
MSWAGLDQRAFPRIQARCDIDIHSFGGPIKAQTQNVGIGGVCVILNRELEKLSQVGLKLALEGSSSPIECTGRIVWMVKSKEPASGKTFFDTGIEFVNLNPQDQECLSTYIKNRR